ncbi:hypothetical protein ACVOMT_13980 [Sphingomonas panni]
MTDSLVSRWAFGSALLLVSVPAGAQDRTAADSDIVVTAQRREELASDVPIAATVLDAARLDDQDIRSLDRLGANVPNLYLARNFGTTSGALVFLRGVGEGIRSSPTTRRSASMSTTCCCRAPPDRCST